VHNGSAAGRDEIDLIVLVRTIWDHRLFLLLIGAIFGGTGIILALTATEIFRAEVAITPVVESEMSGLQSLATQFGGLASLAGVNLGSNTADPSAKAILESRQLVEEFIVRRELMPVLYAGSEMPTLWLGVKRFRENILSITEDPARDLIKVSVDWKDPEEAARWANDFVALANEVLRNRAITESNQNIDFLKGLVENTTVLEVQQVMYDLIGTETKTLMLANARSEYAFRVIDPAVAPEIRVSPRRTIMVIAWAMAGGFIGLVAILVRRALGGAPRRASPLPTPV
jgi:uncharacterized protein involved in exopolysaccharide biosynthesis